MPRFFIDESCLSEKYAFVRGGDAVHIGRSLRMRLGDEVTLCCGGMEYECKILNISDEECRCEIISFHKGENEPNVHLTLFQAVPKSDKLEFIVQKAVELGAAEICPVLTSRCVSRPDGKSFRKKLDRLNKIALEAAKQCGRSIVPTVTEILSLDQCIEKLSAADFPLVCYEKGGKNLREVFSQTEYDGKTIAIFIGSEGGFDEKEIERCLSAGVTPIGLGKRILRCETAPVAAVSIIMNLTGNM